MIEDVNFDSNKSKLQDFPVKIYSCFGIVWYWKSALPVGIISVVQGISLFPHRYHKAISSRTPIHLLQPKKRFYFFFFFNLKTQKRFFVCLLFFFFWQ